MQLDSLTDISMIVYNGHDPVAICKPDYLGFMGLYLKKFYTEYPIGTQLEVELIDHRTNNQAVRVSMIVNKSGSDGMGLRLKSFESEVVNKWLKIICYSPSRQLSSIDSLIHNANTIIFLKSD